MSPPTARRRRPPAADDFARRVARLIDEAGGVSALAVAAGVSEGVVRKWRDGRSEPSRPHLLALAAATGSDVGWLAAGVIGLAWESREVEHGFGAAAAPRPTALLPRLDVQRLAAGEADDAAVEEFVPWRRAWLLNAGLDPGQASLVAVDGDAMAPTLRDGDWAILDRRCERLHDGAIYLLLAHRRAMFRRLAERADDRIELLRDTGPERSELWPRAEFAALIRVVGRVALRVGPVS